MAPRKETKSDEDRKRDADRYRIASVYAIHTREISKKINRTKDAILAIIHHYLTREEAVEYIYRNDPTIEPIYTENVWDSLVADNEDFFELYDSRVKIKKQTETFNACLRKTVEIYQERAFLRNNARFQTANWTHTTRQSPYNMNGHRINHQTVMRHPRYSANNNVRYYPYPAIPGAGSQRFQAGNFRQGGYPPRYQYGALCTNLASQNIRVGTSDLYAMYGEQVDRRALGLWNASFPDVTVPQLQPTREDRPYFNFLADTRAFGLQNASFPDGMVPQLQPTRENQPYFNFSDQTYQELFAQLNDNPASSAMNFDDTQAGGFHNP